MLGIVFSLEDRVSDIDVTIELVPWIIIRQYIWSLALASWVIQPSWPLLYNLRAKNKTNL